MRGFLVSFIFPIVLPLVAFVLLLGVSVKTTVTTPKDTAHRFKCEVEQLPTSEAGLKRHYAVECAPVEITREM